MSMKHLGYWAVALCAFALVAPVYAADGGGGGGGGKGPGGKRPNPVDFILKHASDLNLADDQKTKLKALAEELKKNPPPPPPKEDQGNGGTEKKGRKPPQPPADQNGAGGGDKPAGHRPPPPGMEKVQEILTPDQMAKLKELHDAGGDHAKPPKPPKE